MESERLVVIPSSRSHTRIGDVVRTAIETVHARSRYRLAMLMDDDSTYDPDPVVDDNLRHAAQSFIEERRRAYSIKLGADRALAYVPFLRSEERRGRERV